MKKVTIGDVEEFDNERFCGHYRNLVDIGITACREADVMQTLSFINDLQILVEDLKADMTGEPDECHQCKAKDERIHDLQKSIDILEEIKSVQKTKIAELERMLEQTGNQTEPEKMKVSK
jgi:hypothetical protein